MKLKPYQLVEVNLTEEQWCEQGKRSYIGQVMSFPIPSDNKDIGAAGTIMVRRVPGHPGTLSELPLGQIALLAPHRHYRYVQYAVVSGRGCFPMDMLRYDSCVPVNFDFDMEHSYSGPRAVIRAGEGDDLLVARVTPHTASQWTFARWSSFWWNCKHVRTEKIES